jgi:hypothetical protein
LLLLLAEAAGQVSPEAQAAAQGATAAAAVRAHQDKEIMAVLLLHQAMAAAAVRGLLAGMERLRAGAMEGQERHLQLLDRPLLMQVVAVVGLLVAREVPAVRGLVVMELLINQRAALVRLTQDRVVVAVGIILPLGLAQGATVVQEL